MLILEKSYVDKQRNIKQQVNSCIPLCAIASPLLCTMCTENKHSSVYKDDHSRTNVQGLCQIGLSPVL